MDTEGKNAKKIEAYIRRQLEEDRAREQQHWQGTEEKKRRGLATVGRMADLYGGVSSFQRSQSPAGQHRRYELFALWHNVDKLTLEIIFVKIDRHSGREYHFLWKWRGALSIWKFKTFHLDRPCAWGERLEEAQGCRFRFGRGLLLWRQGVWAFLPGKSVPSFGFGCVLQPCNAWLLFDSWVLLGWPLLTYLWRSGV